MPAGTLTADGRARVLADGNEIPLLGLGVWQVRNGRECEQTVRWALEAGYRHVDTAQAYGNEGSVGRALRDSGVPREDVFLTTKFHPGRRDPVAEVQRSLERLGVDSVDLYIIHWPQGGPTWAWEGMQRARENGYARSIGVSNFGASDLDAVLGVADVPPVLDQVQFSPFEFRRGLLEACEGHGIALEAYSPLGTGRHLRDREVASIAERLGRTPAQVLIRWSLQRGVVVLPKSTHRERIEQNAQVFDFELSPQDMAALDGLDRTGARTAASSGRGGEQPGARAQAARGTTRSSRRRWSRSTSSRFVSLNTSCRAPGYTSSSTSVSLPRGRGPGGSQTRHRAPSRRFSAGRRTAAAGRAGKRAW